MKKDEESGKIRPSLTQQRSLEETRSVLEKRESVYQSLCDFTIDTTKKSTDKVAREIEAAMKQYVGKK
jgi:shikimate kinase